MNKKSIAQLTQEFNEQRDYDLKTLSAAELNLQIVVKRIAERYQLRKESSTNLFGLPFKTLSLVEDPIKLRMLVEELVYEGTGEES